VVTRLLGDHRLLTLTGGPGVGKTRLASHAAAELVDAFRDGVWLVRLSPLEDDEFVTQRVAETVGVPAGAARAPRTILAEFLKTKDMLLVLDNCEHVVRACRDLVNELLPAAAGVRILATSRQPLRANGEWLFDVPPLSVPEGEQPLSGGQTAGNEAVRLFAERAATARPGFTVDDGSRDTIVRLCQRLGGIPLVIELAAVQVRVMPPERILTRLEDHYLQAVSEGARAALPRLETLQTSIDWSFELCSEREQRVWERASVFRGGFDLDAARRVCFGAGADHDKVLGLIAGLANKSVLTRSLIGETGRYGMLEPLRAYGMQRLQASSEARGVRMRHRDHFAGLARQTEQRLLSPGELQVYMALSRDHANLRAALEFSFCESGEARTGLEIATSLLHYWILSGRHREGRFWLDRALAAVPEPSPARAKALLVNAWLACLQDDPEAVRPLIARGHQLARQQGDTAAIAYATDVSGLEALFFGDMRDGMRLFQDALVRMRDIDDRIGVWAALEQLMLTAACMGDADRARAFGEQYVDIADACGGALSKPGSLGVHGFAEWLVGDRQRAARLVRESLTILPSPAAQPWEVAHFLEVLAWDAAVRGEEVRAARLLGSANTRWRFMATPLSRLPTVATEHAHWMHHVHVTLGERQFHALFAEGAALTIDRAITYALAANQDNRQ
jgi:non-specific serine/threonine protein kinase